MADLEIRRDFIEGMNEVFTTLLNDGETDGVNYFALDLENTRTSVYGESRGSKVYSNYVTLVCKAEINPVQGEQPVESVKNTAIFTVPLKSLQDRNLGVTDIDLEQMRRGILEFHNTCYYIDNIRPTAYVEDVFLFYKFECTQILDDLVSFLPVLSDEEDRVLTDSSVPFQILIDEG